MLTTAPGGESSVGQHVVATTSKDQGKTWTPPVDIEPSTGPHASWVVPLLTPYDRLYAFYDYNGDNTSFGKGKNFDSQHGWFVFKYSDDGGKTWSDRHRIPMRETAGDRTTIGGKTSQMFWSVSKPRVVKDNVYISFSKHTEHWMNFGDGWVFHSNNVLNEKEPEKIRWELLPEGDYGIRNPEFGSVLEEHILQPLNAENVFVCVYRTGQGMPAISYSKDACKSWMLPERMRYATGVLIHTPRACPMFWKCSNGNYLFWFHNNASETFQNRNPAWICGGVERDGRIFWSQPEILLYADSPSVRMSYPDLVEINNRYWVSETDKEVGRVHEVDTALLEGMWNTVNEQLDSKTTKIVEKGLVLQTSEQNAAFPKEAANLYSSRGLSLDFVIAGNEWKEGDILFDNRDENKTGIVLRAGKTGTIRLTMRDKNDPNGQSETNWTSDSGVLKELKHFTVIIDSAPKIISFVVNGQFCDGKGQRTFGWGRFTKIPTDLSGSGTIKLAPQVQTLRIYNRYLRTNEAVSNHLASPFL
jgi:hypothetical protein